MGLISLKEQKTRRNGDALVKQLKSFELDLKFSAGVWFFSPGGGRFHDRYVKPMSLQEKFDITAKLQKYGLQALEAHYPNEVNDENVDQYIQFRKDTGIRLVTVVPLLFFDSQFEFGSLSNPIDASREKAKRTLIANLKFIGALGGGRHVGVWPGIDGYTVPLGHHYFEMWDRFESAVAEAMDEAPGVRVAIEPKPYEPAPNNIYRTTADGLIACNDIEARLKHATNRALVAEGHALVGMQPEIGHVRMGFEDLAYAYLRVARQGRLAHTHWNSQPLGNYDQDLNVGVVAWEQTEALLYALKMIGYTGHFGIDINPERMPMQKAIEINWRALSAMNNRINALPHERILACYFEPDQHRGELELILAEARR